MADLPLLPVRIVQMIRELHQRGYESLYLYAGMSPSGLYWRFTIGIIDQTHLWPGDYRLVNTSIGTDHKPEWSSIDASAIQLADDFEKYFATDLIHAKQSRPDFIAWFSNMSEKIGNNLLFFSADYEAPHKSYLDNAPYYRK